MQKSFIYEYLNEIEKGNIVANVWIKGMYSQLLPVLDGKDERYKIDFKKGHKPIDFIQQHCKQTTGEYAGKTIDLMLFQKAKLEATFGIVYRDTGYRRFNQIFDLRAKKNGKTVENAAIALYLLGFDKEGGAEIYSAATKKDQAKLAWNAAKAMVQKNELFDEIFRVNNQGIFCDALDGTYKTLSKDKADTMDGLNIHGAIIDEVHALSREIYDILVQGTATRRQWLFNMISTAGTKRGGLFDDLYKSMLKIAIGQTKKDDTLAIMYQLDEGDDWRDESVWQKANPALGVMKPVTSIRKELEQINIDPSFEATVKVKHFNILGMKNNSWLSFDQVDNEATFDLKEFKNKLVIGSFDLSKILDLTAVSFIAWDKKTKTWLTHQMYWMPKNTFDKLKNGDVAYKQWVDRGYLRLSGEHHISYHDIAEYFLWFVKSTKCRLEWIYYDGYSADYLVEELASFGFSNMERTFQGYKSLSLPMQMLGAELTAKRVNYQDNQVTKWCLTNTETEVDVNGNIKPKKFEDKRTLRIDGTAVLIDNFFGVQNHLQDMQNY